MNPTPALTEPPELKRFGGPQRAAAMMLMLGGEHGAPIWEELSTDEIKELSVAIAQLGRVPAAAAEHLLIQFASEMSGMRSLHGSYETAERLLKGIVPDDRLKEIMEDIRGPSGRTMWDKLSNVNEVVLAAYLRNEYPQTVAVIMSKLKPDHCARVLGAMPQDFATEVIQRMLKLDHVQKDVLNEVEETLKLEFMSNLSRAQTVDPHEKMADVFNAMDRTTEEAMLSALDDKTPDSAERIRKLMFTFEDLAGLLPAAIGAVVRNADKKQLALALKGSPTEMAELFFNTMTTRAAKMLRDDIEGMGPVRARDCEEAQNGLVALAKSLAEKGEIALVDPRSDDSMIV